MNIHRVRFVCLSVCGVIPVDDAIDPTSERKSEQNGESTFLSLLDGL